MKLLSPFLLIVFLHSDAFAVDLSTTEASVFDVVFKFVLAMHMKYLGTIYVKLMACFLVPIRIMMAMYILYVAYSVATEGYREWRGVLFTCVYISLAYASLMEWGFYSEYIVKPTIELGLDLSAFFISVSDKTIISSTSDLFQTLDKMLEQIFAAIEMYAPKGHFLMNAGSYLIYLIAALPLYICFILLNLLFFYLFTISFVGMFVFLVIGGPILMMAAFRHCHGIVKTWFKAMMNYLFSIIFISIVMGIYLNGLLELVELSQEQALAGVSILSILYLKVMVWCIFAILCLRMAPTYASQLCNSIGGSPGSLMSVTLATTSLVLSGAIYGERGPMSGSFKQNSPSLNATEILNKERNIRGSDR
jgi:hypothetical protein